MAAKANKTARPTHARAAHWTRKSQDPRAAFGVPARRSVPRVPVHRPRRVPGRR
jgi:hypothetical protein